jgi:hypothetical protein
VCDVLQRKVKVTQHAGCSHDGIGLALVAHGPTAVEARERKWQEISEGRMIVAAEALRVHGLLAWDLSPMDLQQAPKLWHNIVDFQEEGERRKNSGCRHDGLGLGLVAHGPAATTGSERKLPAWGVNTGGRK